MLRDGPIENVETRGQQCTFACYCVPPVLQGHAWGSAVRRLVSLIIAILAVGLTHDAAAGERLALIITNQAYSPQLGALTKTFADGEILKRALEKAGFTVRIVKDADKSTMLAALTEYAGRLEGAGQEGTGFFYFAGHGVATEKFGNNYLIPVDAQIGSQEQLMSFGVQLGDVINRVSRINGQVNFVVIDACREAVFSPVPGQRGLKPEFERRGVLIEFSTGPGDVAVDDNIFSKALAEEMGRSGREALQMFRAVRLKVLEATHDVQFPWTRDGLDKDFFFTGPPAANADADRLNAARMQAEWEAIKDTNSAALLEKFEHRYGSGMLSEEARRRLVAIGGSFPPVRTLKPGTPIAVWSVASPHPGVVDPKAVVPPGLEHRATALGYAIELSIVPAKEFAQRLFATMGTDKQPDILSMDNYGHLTGITTGLGKFMGIQENTQVRQSLVAVEEVLSAFAKGWQFLLRGSPNHDVARALVEDLVGCDEEALDEKQAVPAELRRLSEAAAVKLVECRLFDRDTTDPSRLPTTCRTDGAPLRVKGIRTCRIVTNDRLAFASSVVAIESSERVGRRSVVTVLHKTDAWRVLSVTADPLSTKQFGADALTFARRLVPFAPKAALPMPARIVTADGTYPQPGAGQRFGDFVWEGSTSPGVIGEIAEFNYGYDVRLFLLPGTPGGKESRLSAGRLGTTKSPWVWRVWSIDRDGSVAFSDVRQFRKLR